jgi:hypothetical protein
MNAKQKQALVKNLTQNAIMLFRARHKHEAMREEVKKVVKMIRDLQGK